MRLRVRLKREAETSAAENGALGLFGGIDPTGIGEETDVVGHAVFKTTTDIAETVTFASAVSCTTASEGVRSEVQRADRVTKEEVTRGSPLGVRSTAEDVLFHTDTDEFGEEIVNSESTTPAWTTLVVESACGKCVNLEFLIAEFAFLSGSYGLFEGLG